MGRILLLRDGERLHNNLFPPLFILFYHPTIFFDVLPTCYFVCTKALLMVSYRVEANISIANVLQCFMSWYFIDVQKQSCFFKEFDLNHL